MKNTLIIAFCLLAQLTLAQQQYCGCYLASNVPADYLYQKGRVSAVYGKVNTPLTHGDEIRPQGGTTITFKFNETPDVRNSCRKYVVIDVYDEKERKYIYSMPIDNLLEAAYTFPLSDRTYTVTLTVSASSTATEDRALIATGNRDCGKKISVFVKPTIPKEILTKPTKVFKN